MIKKKTNFENKTKVARSSKNSLPSINPSDIPRNSNNIFTNQINSVYFFMKIS